MALLTVLSLPWIAAAALRAGLSRAALEAELIKPLYMTGIELSARALAFAMTLGLIWATMRLWTRLAGRRTGLFAGVLTAANATLIYYGHTGNLEVPYLFWVTCAMVELDRVACGEAREMRALVVGVAAVLTKDQALGALLLPGTLCLVVIPWVFHRRPPARRALVRAALVAAGLYAVGSGAIVNPAGFRRRIAFLMGPASQSWATYPPGWRGLAPWIRDVLGQVQDFTSRPIALAAIVGIVASVFAIKGEQRLRTLVPLSAAVSFTVLFTLAVRRSEHRFLLPQSVFLVPYAGLAFDFAWRTWTRSHVALLLAGIAALGPAVLGVASLDGTLVLDPRYEAERFLAALPSGTHVEVYGGPLFLPRVPWGLVATRPGVEPPSDRQAIAGVTDIVDPSMDPRRRGPTAIVLSTEFSAIDSTRPSPTVRPYALAQYGDDKSHALFQGLWDGRLGYKRVFAGQCRLPWPLRCVRIHSSTGREVWIYEPRSTVAGPPSAGREAAPEASVEPARLRERSSYF
jgi:4-amino-4-deoxy-L-arabinose transferase-like glycosyltransferase